MREAQQEFDRTPTAFNEARLARAWLAQGDAAKAVEIYRRAASGPYARDPSFLKGLAIAQLEAGQAAEAVATLDTLFGAHPDQRAGDLALMQADARRGNRRSRELNTEWIRAAQAALKQMEDTGTAPTPSA